MLDLIFLLVGEAGQCTLTNRPALACPNNGKKPAIVKQLSQEELEAMEVPVAEPVAAAPAAPAAP